jgi:hypothetical protein
MRHGSLNALDADSIGVRSKSLEIVDIGRQYGAARFGQCHHESINGGAFSGKTAELCGSPGERLGAVLNNVTSLEKAIRQRVTSRVTLETLDEHW